MLLEFENKNFIVKKQRLVNLPEKVFNKVKPLVRKFSYDNATFKYYTPLHTIAAPLRSYANECARKELDRILIHVEPLPGPTIFSRDSYDFQDNAVRFAITRNRLYLALDPGLGKTVVAALVSKYLHQFGYHTFYICPPSLVENTLQEFTKWGANQNFTVIPDSMLHKRRKDIVAQAAFTKSLLIVDEAHRFNSPGSQRTRALYHKTFGIVKHFDKIILMSGSPMPNRPLELYPMLKRLAPETIDFMDRFDYGMKYCAGYEDKKTGHFDFNGASNFKYLVRCMTEKFMLRIRKKEVLKSLPPKTEQLVFIGDNLPAKVAALDKKLLAQFSPDDLMGHLSEHVSTYRKLLGKIKVKPALAYINDVLDGSNESVIIFAHHVVVISALVEGLKKFNPLLIDGTVEMSERQKIAKEFQSNPARRVFIGNIAACGLGFTLTKATRVIFVESAWTPGVNNQAADRAHRIGQKDNVFVQYLVFKNSIDRAVIETCMRKNKTIEEL